jgi:hypothetical protein
MSGPKSVVVEYDDSTRREISFNQVGRQAQLELASLGLCNAPCAEKPKAYLLLQWKDGWKEIVAVDERATELLRYYTIERVEEIGRISLETGSCGPELLLIKRLPGDIESILLVGNEELKAYGLQEKVTIKEGGKVEHVFYDKKRPNFCEHDAVTASAWYAVILDSIEKELQSKGVSATSVLVKGEDERLAFYKELVDVLGLKGTERQQDVHGFLQAALQKIGRWKHRRNGSPTR